MKDYQRRVIEEKKELDAKIKKLASFFSTETAINLDTQEQDRLSRQLSCMSEYSQILDERIKNFHKDE